MGAASSVESARSTVAYMLTNKPADASDIRDLDTAKAEIINLRKIARDFQNQLREEMKKVGVNEKQKRDAVLDRGEMIKNSTQYVPKVVDKNQLIRELLLNVVTSNILFQSYSSDEHNAIVDAFEPLEVAANTHVIKQGESGDYFYVVEKGTLDIFVKGKDGDQVKVGTSLGVACSFGELALMYNTPRSASIKSVTDCRLWVIDRACYRGILVYFKYLRNKQYMEFLRNVEIMEKKLGDIMSESELEKMTVSLERETYEAGETIIRQGNVGDNFYIIAEGDVGVHRHDPNSNKEEKLTVLHQGGYFGEKALLREDVRQASCIAETKVVCLTLCREDFIDMLGTLDDIINKKNNSDDAATDADGEKTIAPVNPRLSTDGDKENPFKLDISFDDLELKSTLGCGAFGRVKLCRLKSGDQYYALKCQSKSKIVESGLQEHVLNEMRVMRKINHPFIARLYVSLQDKYNIYFVVELLQGGELFTHLRNRGKLPEQAARFYASIVVYAFSTLHAKKIAYRDLKPENLVMDSRGYVKLVDFGLAKQLLSGKTWTLCGTPDYLAPEIILNEGHDLAVDYWALGVLIFEMVVGAPPFYAEDPIEVYEKILSGNPSMPSFFTRNLSDLIKKLLRSQQGKRLGNTRGGTAAVVKHKWFSSFDWASLESGEMKAPHVPVINSKDDVTNFDKFDDGELPPPSDWNPELNK